MTIVPGACVATKALSNQEPRSPNIPEKGRGPKSGGKANQRDFRWHRQMAVSPPAKSANVAGSGTGADGVVMSNA